MLFSVLSRLIFKVDVKDKELGIVNNVRSCLYDTLILVCLASCFHLVLLSSTSSTDAVNKNTALVAVEIKSLDATVYMNYFDIGGSYA